METNSSVPYLSAVQCFLQCQSSAPQIGEILKNATQHRGFGCCCLCPFSPLSTCIYHRACNAAGTSCRGFHDSASLVSVFFFFFFARDGERAREEQDDLCRLGGQEFIRKASGRRGSVLVRSWGRHNRTRRTQARYDKDLSHSKSTPATHACVNLKAKVIEI